jgi:hypothetical protein
MDGSIMGINAFFALNYAFPAMAFEPWSWAAITRDRGVLPPRELCCPYGRNTLAGDIGGYTGRLYAMGKKPLPLVYSVTKALPPFQNRENTACLDIKAVDPTEASAPRYGGPE